MFPEREAFLWPVRVYYEDTDSGGVVYYANYLKFMERARTEWLRSLGLEQDRLIDEFSVLFAVRSVALDYRAPARFNDALQVSVRPFKKGRASLSFRQQVMRDAVVAEQRQLLCEGQIKIACLDVRTLRPRPMPDPVYAEIVCED
jgi:acyl-CoA thioester hydrolase